MPVAVTLAGGYAPQVQDTVDINFQTILKALEFKNSLGKNRSCPAR